LYPAEGRERLIAISRYFNYEEGWTTLEQIHAIRTKMNVVAQIEYAQAVPMQRIHGDAWRENVRVCEGGVTLFDNALAVGPAGYDVAFAIGDQLIRNLVLGDVNALNNAKAFLEGYADALPLKNAFLGFAYKCVVGAAFDGYDQENRIKLIALAEEVLDEHIKDPEASLTIEQIQLLWSKII
jgi:hypothetical protein